MMKVTAVDTEILAIFIYFFHWNSFAMSAVSSLPFSPIVTMA